MMEREKIYSKLLDFWTPPPQSGEPIGLITTTYSFNLEFFENECLYRFLKMDTDPEEDDLVFIIEREEKLNNIHCSILIDQSHLQPKRNLRWDIIPIRQNRGVFHAKITILYWSEHVRILISSANLTTDGYRRNREIVSVMDFSPESTSPLYCAFEIIDYLVTVIEADKYSDDIIKNRATELLNKISSVLTSWNIKEINETKQNFNVYPVLISPGSRSFFDQVKEIWNNNAGNNPPSNIIVTSPFYDLPGSKNEPSIKVWEFLRRKGQASIQYNCRGYKRPDSNVVAMSAPDSLLNNIPGGRSDVNITFCMIDQNEIIKSKQELRPFHMKSYFIESDSGWVMYIIGSSNFTSNGLGLSKYCNYEANIIYMVNKNKDRNLYNELSHSVLEGELTDVNNIKWEQTGSEDENTDENTNTLHNFFKNALLIKSDKTEIKFSFNNTEPPDGFIIKTERGDEIYNISNWYADNKPDKVFIEWRDLFFPSGFNVFWNGITVPAYMPLNVSDYSILPEQEEIKDLPLDVLSNILASVKPAYLIIKYWLNRNNKKKEKALAPLIDPHKRVDTHNFLLQKTRKYSISINSIKNKLEKPVYTIETLEWRINGPLGIKAFLNALIKESETTDEKLFFFSEVLISLMDVNISEAVNTVSSADVKSYINDFIQKEVMTILSKLISESGCQEINEYSLSVMKKVNLIYQNKI